ncbi:hypothetical protein E4U19_002592 [Claviceps sp. Clav32 group G5]|nr:hypothetical protein E4U19_002592 [Claviceps sp. Clav32 group G5]
MDIHHEMIPLHFYTKGLGTEMPPSLCHRDNTVAILDASQDVFGSGTPGIRIDDPQKIKIFPHLLDRIISLNNNVRESTHGLASDDFEDWLWKTKEPEGLARPMSPPDKGWFSGFADLPHRDDIDAGGSVKIPHSCFLGEIVAVNFYHRLEFEIRDIYDETIPLRFHTNGEGAELPPEEYSRGDTVAVLDASRYDFEDGVSGIRHEEPWMMKVTIFPLCLDEVLALNDQVHEFSFRQQNNTRKCHGCGKTSAEASMKRCDKCLLFWYFNSECQEVGRNTKAHEDDCMFLEDPDLQALFLIKWKDLQNHIHFPLRVTDAS